MAFALSIIGFSVAWAVTALRMGVGGWAIEPARRRSVVAVTSVATGIAIVTVIMSAALLVRPVIPLLIAVICALCSAVYALSQRSRL